VRQPKVFLFDEPLSNLDANLRVQMRTEISRLHHQLQTTMIYVTHDQIEAMSMGDRIVVLRDGIVQQVDTPLNIYHRPANKFVAGFIGSPTMNFFQGALGGNGATIFRQEGTALSIAIPTSQAQRLLTVKGKTIVMGVRPEHLFIQPPASDSPMASFRARIEVVEPVGNEIFIYFTTGGGGTFVARIAANNPPPVGSTEELFVDTSKVHFFDRETEKTL
jgi:multiple sugar transport system ATP-binding protein